VAQYKPIQIRGAATRGQAVIYTNATRTLMLRGESTMNTVDEMAGEQAREMAVRRQAELSAGG